MISCRNAFRQYGRRGRFSSASSRTECSRPAPSRGLRPTCLSLLLKDIILTKEGVQKMESCFCGDVPNFSAVSTLFSSWFGFTVTSFFFVLQLIHCHIRYYEKQPHPLSNELTLRAMTSKYRPSPSDASTWKPVNKGTFLMHSHRDGSAGLFICMYISVRHAAIRVTINRHLEKCKWIKRQSYDRYYKRNSKRGEFTMKTR